MAGKSVLLIGASGLVGTEILKLLKRDSLFTDVIVLTRRIIPHFDNIPKINQIVINFDNLQSYKNSVKADCVISTLGTTIKKAGSRENFKRIDFGYTLEIAKTAKQNGTEHFLLVSSMGASPQSKVFYNRIKGEVEQGVSQLDFKAVSIFRPSLLMGKRDEFRLGEAAGKALMRIFSFAIPKKYEATEAYQLAEVILHAARKDKPGINIYEADQIQDIYYEQL